MALLPPEVHAALSELLPRLQTADNVARSSAEQQLSEEWEVPRPDVLLIGLSEQMQGAQDQAVCSRKEQNIRI